MTKQVMTACTQLQIIHIVTDVHIRVRGTRGKHLCELQCLFLCLIAQEVLTFTYAVIQITIKTSFKWESLLTIGNAYL